MGFSAGDVIRESCVCVRRVVSLDCVHRASERDGGPCDRDTHAVHRRTIECEIFKHAQDTVLFVCKLILNKFGIQLDMCQVSELFERTY